MFLNFKNGLFLLLAYALSGGFTQFMKGVFFGDLNRPFFYSSYYGLKIKIVDDVHMFIHNSFPSGHSTTAFCLFFCLSYMVKPTWAKILLFVIGIFTAFSRVYLSQHFFEDIFAGAIIGVTFSSLLAWMFFISPLSSKMNNLNKPVYKVFSKE
ncbi:MAG: phosphatase PAP2 family protein [Bacteroidota bacterium]|nr:phosphatase PAP2 family protein [Bacteroidota bacterium]